MIYHLFNYLKSFDIPGQGLLNYLSFRAMLATVASLLFALWFGKKTIAYLQKKQIGESIRNLGLEGQMSKKGTPTMGGIIIIASILVGVLLFANLTNIYILLLLGVTIWLGGLGFLDDYIKVFKHNKDGLSEKRKLLGQLIAGLGIAIAVWLSPDITVMETVSSAEAPQATEEISDSGAVSEPHNEYVVKSTKTTIPFVKSHEFDYKWLSPLKGVWNWYTKWAIYMIMIVLVIMACSNSVNLTDGLDGLAAGTSTIVTIVLGIFAWLGGNIIQADYLNIMYIPGSGEIAVFMAATAGSLLGFLWYNSYPAQVFMGDTGSLALGGIIGVCAVLIRKELLLPLLCGIFFVEALSVIIQRAYFKHSKKQYGTGRRFFKMAPIHHHFQKSGIPSVITKPEIPTPEAKITTRFWLIGIVLAVSTIALLKLR
ncbi:MAG: phospho-N-acetylmuramoyl-pentapeptide-transferase [Bacteroidales bacterium]|nr:phospho-N-acetylmuramoyl-pentapeptide-transferase [Bacteroidales bacterium]